jgi:hypothetical protein
MAGGHGLTGARGEDPRDHELERKNAGREKIGERVPAISVAREGLARPAPWLVAMDLTGVHGKWSYEPPIDAAQGPGERGEVRELTKAKNGGGEGSNQRDNARRVAALRRRCSWCFSLCT